MIGMRSILIHEYDDVDLTIVWKTVQSELPRIIVMVERLLECSGHQSGTRRP